MEYNPEGFAVGRRDVIAAWIVVVVVAIAAIVIRPEASADTGVSTASARAAAYDAFCSNTRAPAPSHRG
jgi:hypothetical protein